MRIDSMDMRPVAAPVLRFHRDRADVAQLVLDKGQEAATKAPLQVCYP